jgi:predicted phage gp36 major capsid-like protein
MRRIGLLLIVVGFLAGAFFAVEQRDGIPVAPFLLSLAVGVAGVVMARAAERREATAAETIRTNLATIETSLASVVAKVETLDDRKADQDVYELRHVIDRDFPDDLDAFVQARESMRHSFGLQAYADVMNPFAAGERYLNRVWSASTDGYVDEAHDYLSRSREQFEQALKIFRGLRGQARTG